MVNILDIKDLQISFPPWTKPKMPVRQMGLTVPKGSVTGLVGQSGSGKSLVSLAVMGMVPEPGRITKGSILFENRDLARFDRKQYRKIRGKELFLIFQGCGNALTPSLTIGRQMAEIFENAGGTGKRKSLALAEKALERVRLESRVLDAYPFELSGGMRQRVMIGMAAAIRPKLLIADEPTTGLDMVTQAEILDIFKEFKTSSRVSTVFISHDLRIISQLADEVTVMFKGKNVDQWGMGEISDQQRQLHPHSIDLINACKMLVYPEAQVDDRQATA